MRVKPRPTTCKDGATVIEIRFHGRGGQGAVIASELLAQAAFLEGKHPQSFPFFGVERRGAPVAAFTRIDTQPIQVRTSITDPDIVIVLDPGLAHTVPVAAGLKPTGLLLLNTTRKAKDVKLPTLARVVTLDASGIALAHGLGSAASPIVNTAMLGALVSAWKVVSLPSLLAAIRAFVPAKVEANVKAAEQAAAAVAVEQAVRV